MSDILFTVQNHVGIITLNRPSALNALSFEMIKAMYAQLLNWQNDDNVNWVLVHSNSAKAFCAGGDVRALHGMQGDLREAQAYFADEYQLNYLPHHCAKPYVALMDGIVMGGGMGIAQGADLRVVTETSRLAMPETAIGLVPDVGGSYFLSRTHDNPAIGRYLAMTGAIINATDACRWRLADVLVPQSSLPRLMADLIACVHPSIDALRAIAQTHIQKDLQPTFDSVSVFESAIMDVFKNDFEQIQTQLSTYLNHDATAHWAQHTLAQIAYNSPLAMRMALHNQALGRGATLGECLRLEFDSISSLLTLGEGIEGIRAKLVDKDNAPQWRNDVANVLPPSAIETHPLRSLK